MKKKEMVLTSSKDLAKALLKLWGPAFLFVLAMLLFNQLILLHGFFTRNHVTPAQGIVFGLYSLPAVIVTAIPYSVCIGFTYGLIKMKFMEKQPHTKKKTRVENPSHTKKNIRLVLLLGLIMSIVTFLITDFIMTVTNANFSKLYWTVSTEEGNYVESPRDMNSLKIIQGLDEARDNPKTLNTYILELNKKYSLPLGALFFAIFALSLSSILQRHPKIGLCVSLVSCLVYWAFTMYGQMFSVRSGKFGALAMWLPNIVFFCIALILFFIKNTPRDSARVAAAKEY